MEIVSLGGLPLEDQLLRLSQLPPDSVVIFVSYRADSQGRSMVARDVLRPGPRASSAPVYGASATWLGNGIVGGDLIRYAPIGESAALLAVRGSSRARTLPSIVPIEQPSSQLEFDWRAARALGHRRGAPARRAASCSSARRRCGRSTGGRILGALGLLLAQTP